MSPTMTLPIEGLQFHLDVVEIPTDFHHDSQHSSPLSPADRPTEILVGNILHDLPSRIEKIDPVNQIFQELVTLVRHEVRLDGCGLCFSRCSLHFFQRHSALS